MTTTVNDAGRSAGLRRRPGRSDRVALVTCARLPDLDPDDRHLVSALEALGRTAEPVVWDDPTVDWSAYAVAVLRSTWDYAARRDEFLAWAASVPRLANPADVVAWNTDKRYLAHLAEAGVPVAATEWIEPGQRWDLPEAGEWVIKPAVGAGSIDAGRYDLADAAHRSMAAAHVERLHRAGRVVMLQPYLHSVDTHGETCLIFLAGAYSHAVRKSALLDGPDLGTTALFKQETVSPCIPTDAEHAVAASALAAVPGGWRRLLYARVDLLPGPDGDPVVVELELTEPSLFLGTADGAAARLARAVAAAAGGQVVATP